MHISNLLATLPVLASHATAQLVSGGYVDNIEIAPRSQFDFCNLKGINRYVTAVPSSASSSVKSWCTAQTLTAGKSTVRVTSTATVTSVAKATGKNVTKTRSKTEYKVTKTLVIGTRTVTVRKKSTATAATGVNISVVPNSATTSLATKIVAVDKGIDIGVAIKRRSLPDPTEEKIHIKRVSSRSSSKGRPSKWSHFSNTVVAQICNCLGSPWKTVTASGVTTSTIWKTSTKFTTTTGTVAAETTTIKVTVTGNGTATVDVVATATVMST
ncbi:hypothetical protein TWF694_008812 [Orbilia ellipsospora]|uniref:Uncharacterized protein n=1 Tax=Orbilia ellipsospora TaxID=2528407 RepID=A0AAV9XD04_9PEZI